MKKRKKNPVVRGAESGLRASSDHLRSASRTLRIAFDAITSEGGERRVFDDLRTAESYIAAAYSIVKSIKRVKYEHS